MSATPPPAPAGPKPLKTFFTAEQLQADTSFSDLNVSEAMIKQASLFAHYASMAAAAQRQADDTKLMSEIIESKVDKRLRDKAVEKGTKITEALISKEIARDKEYVLAIKRLNEAKMIADLGKNATEALKHRRDMLIQIGVQQREEMKGELFLKGGETRDAQRRDDLRDRAARLATTSQAS